MRDEKGKQKVDFKEEIEAGIKKYEPVQKQSASPLQKLINKQLGHVRQVDKNVKRSKKH